MINHALRNIGISNEGVCNCVAGGPGLSRKQFCPRNLQHSPIEHPRQSPLANGIPESFYSFLVRV